MQYFPHLTEWFQQQTQFTTKFERMEVNEMRKSLEVLSFSEEKRQQFLQSLNGSRSPSEVTVAQQKIFHL